MAVTLLAWLISLGVHLAFALFMLLPASGTAYDQGAGEDIMVVEQGIALEGFAKLGEDLVTVEPVDVIPSQLAMAQTLPEEVKPIEDHQVIASEEGPEQVDFKEPEEIEPEPKEIEELKEEVKEPEPEVIEQPLPPQIASIEQHSVAAQLESAGEEQIGGSTTDHTAYLGKLRNHLEQHKVNPRTSFKGTAVVEFTIGSNGEIASRRVAKSSGSKVLDDAALASIDKAVPFPPIPDVLHRNQIDVTVPFRFTVR
ncbi:MAG: energy transducer TonB family protein [Methyloceanibacter sp.]